MGLLDQLFTDDPVRAKVNVSKDLSAGSRTSLATAISVLHAINGGFNTVGNAQENLDRSFVRQRGPGSALVDIREKNGVVSLKELSDRVSFFKERLSILDDQFAPPAQKDTADFVLSGGIKKGTRCLIQIESAGRRVSKKSIKDLLTKDIYKNQRALLSFDKFSVESINEPDEEKYQILETMSADFLYAFGRRPRIYIMSGNVLNGRYDTFAGGELFSMDWKNAFQRSYGEKLRASKLIQNGSKVVISLQDTIYTGYVLNLIATTAAFNQSVSQVTMTFVLKSVHYAGSRDERIPGVKVGGLVVPSKRTPEELFPEPNLEDFFQGDAKTLLEEEISNLENNVLKPLRSTFATKIGATSDDVDTGFLAWLDDPDKEPFSMVSGVTGHSVFNHIFGSKFTSEAFALADTKKNLTEARNKYIDTYFGNPEFSVTVDTISILPLAPLPPISVNLPLVFLDNKAFVPPKSPHDATEVILSSWNNYSSQPIGRVPLITADQTEYVTAIYETAVEEFNTIRNSEGQVSMRRESLIKEMRPINSMAEQLAARYKFWGYLKDRLDQID